jgi:Predicted membrane protein (DUF2232)
VASPSPGTLPPAKQGRGWPRAAALLLVVLVTSVARPSVLVAVPYLALGLVLGLRRTGVVLLALLCAVLAFAGAPRDGSWYLERAWGLLLGGWFAALTLRRPASTFSDRALGAFTGATAVAALVLGLRAGGWGSVQWVVRDRMTQGVSTALDAVRALRGGRALPPAVVTAVYEAVDKQIQVFPAVLGIASVAALGVAWWAYVRLSVDNDQAVGPLKNFRFNDHLVWVLIGGVLLLVVRWDGSALVGANAVVFMGALYTLRGAAVILFLSGGLSIFGYFLLGLGLLFVPPLVLTGAMVVGIGDTWLDVRKKLGGTRG